MKHEEKKEIAGFPLWLVIFCSIIIPLTFGFSGYAISKGTDLFAWKIDAPAPWRHLAVGIICLILGIVLSYFVFIKNRKSK